MVNLECKLTVDDLIVEYMMYKVKNGYEPSFLTLEFMDFLRFFESKMQVEDSLYENDKLFQRFFERKAKSDWSRTINWYTSKKEVVPHMEIIYSEKDNDYLIKANYKLSDFDKELHKKILSQKILHWDDTAISIDKKQSCLRFYGTEKLLFRTSA